MEPSVVGALARLGGVARRADLAAACGRPALEAALARGELRLLTRGVYASRDLDTSRGAAAAVSGVLSHRSSAIDWGWAVRTVPDRPDVTLPRRRTIAAERLLAVRTHWADLRADEVVDGRTSRDRTLVDCLRSLPWDEALAVADSALRSGVSPDHLAGLARDARGPGSAAIRRVAAAADGRAANPFESSLRALCLEVPGLHVVPQVRIARLGVPDLVDEHLGLVLEADSFAWHGGREALHRDANRYNAFVAAGWVVLRFSWEEVMFHPLRVRTILGAVVDRRAEVPCARCRAA